MIAGLTYFSYIARTCNFALTTLTTHTHTKCVIFFIETMTVFIRYRLVDSNNVVYAPQHVDVTDHNKRFSIISIKWHKHTRSISMRIFKTRKNSTIAHRSKNARFYKMQSMRSNLNWTRARDLYDVQNVCAARCFVYNWIIAPAFDAELAMSMEPICTTERETETTTDIQYDTHVRSPLLYTVRSV